MQFFKSTPGLPDHEKARLEFHLQQLAECIGFDSMQLPILSADDLLGRDEPVAGLPQILKNVGRHLRHDVSQISIKTVPQPLEMCGGGG